MKTFTILLIILVVVVGLIGFGLQTFLTKGLTAALNNTVLPVVKSEYGLDVSITNAAINLLRGRVEVEGLAIRNLPGYKNPMLLTADSFRLKFELLSFIKRAPIVIRSAKATGVMLTVERNAQQNINIRELVEKFQTAEKPDQQTLEELAAELPPEERIPLAVAGATGQFPIHIRRVFIEGTVVYSDAGMKSEYPIDLRLTGSDLFTVPAADQPDSLLVLRGSLHNDLASFTTDLNAIVSPLIDPARPSFNATGSILNIDAVFLQELLTENDMASGPFSIRPSIVCKQSQLRGSHIDLVLTGLNIYGAEIGDTTLPLPLKGTLQQPGVELTGALQALFSAQSVNIIKTIGLKELSNRTADPASTNLPSNPTLSDVLIEQLGKKVNEIGENQDIQDSIRQLGDSLFGK